MWLCCGPSNQYGQNIGFNNHLKAVAWRLHKELFSDYNCIHVRRSGGHTGPDRKHVSTYYKQHLQKFDKSTPLYIATDEKDKEWFEPLRTEFGFKELYYWRDLNQDIVERELSFYPETMAGDITGFIEQLICADATKFEGSHASTFSVAIKKFRSFPDLHRIKV